MLWLATASGFVVWESLRRIRRRTRARALRGASTISSALSPVCSCSDWPELLFGTSSDGRAVCELREVRLALTSFVGAFNSSTSCPDAEALERVLLRAQKALPLLCNLLETSNDAWVLVEAVELLALLSPSRRGFQPAICEAGVVYPLLRLLVLCVSQDTSLSHTSAAAAAIEAEQPGGAVGSCKPAPFGAASACILGHVLRTLVNLTSNNKSGAPVRQAILRDDWAVAALLRLLDVEPGLEASPGLDTTAPVTGCSDGDRERILDQNQADMAATGSASPSAAGRAMEATWQLAGLSAWLTAHLCSMPAGQLQLAQEGVVPLLVRLVRKGRMTWSAAVDDVDQRAAVMVAAPGSPACARRRGSGAAGFDATRLSGVSSAMLCDAVAAAAADGSSDASLPYVLAAVQYALMALVNITFDNSANQRAAAMAGVLTELDTLFGELLQPGVLAEKAAVELTPPIEAALAGRDLGCAVARAPAGQAHAVCTQSPRTEKGRNPEQQQQQAQQPEPQLLLRTCCQGVAKFSVWLLAHLSSSDPDLKAAITGPYYSFVPRLLGFLMYREPHPATTNTGNEDGSRTDHAAPAQAAAAAWPSAVPQYGDPRVRRTVIAASAPILVVRQYASMALVNLTCGVPATKAAVASAMDWVSMADLLTWLGDVSLLQPAAAGAVASQSSESGTAATSGSRSEAAAVAASPQPAVPPGPTADLLLYTVWLLQHLSLSPYAAAAANPRVIEPLVRLLAAADPHVRLRTAAALGALCSSTLPSSPAATACVAAAADTSIRAPAGTADADAAIGKAGAVSQGDVPHRQGRQQPSPAQARTDSRVQTGGMSSEAHPHRVAFMAAGGVQRLLAAARVESDPHLLAYDMLCLSSAVGEDNVAAVAEAVTGGALELLEALMCSEHAACLIPAAEALQALARAARNGLKRSAATGGWGTAGGMASDVAAAVAAAADYVPRSLLSRVVAVMLTHMDPRVRAAMNEALGALTSLPGVRDRYCAVFAETLRDLVTAAEVELKVTPVS